MGTIETASLLACPHCGGEAICEAHGFRLNGDIADFFLGCPECEVGFQGFAETDPDAAIAHAIEVWNRRDGYS